MSSKIVETISFYCVNHRETEEARPEEDEEHERNVLYVQILGKKERVPCDLPHAEQQRIRCEGEPLIEMSTDQRE